MPRRYTSDADRRARDREIQRLAANRRVGHDHAYLILYGIPGLRILVPLLLAAGGALWAWFYVDHKVIAFAAAAGGITLCLLYTANTIHATGWQARQQVAAGMRKARPFWWHGVALAGVVLLALAYVVLPL